MLTFLRRRLWILLLYPIAVGYTPGSSRSETWLDVILGLGTIVDVTRDCSGRVVRTEHLPYGDGAMGITYTSGELILSGHVGYTSVHPFESSYGYDSDDLFERPFIQAVTNKPYVTARIGINRPLTAFIGGITVLPHKTKGLYLLPSCSLRAGSETSIAMTVNILEPTLLATGTALDVGVNGPLGATIDGYGGVGIDLFGSAKFNSRFTLWNTARTHSFIIGGGIGLEFAAAPWSLTFGYKTRL